MSSLAYPYPPYASALPQVDAGRSRIFTQAGIGTFLIGVASGIPVQAVGRLFIGELFLIALAPVVMLLLFGLPDEYGKTARTLLIAMIVSWVGYLLSDLVRGTPSIDYLRGWSRWVAIGATFATLAWLGSKNISYLLSFLAGLAVGGLLAPFVTGGFFGPVYYWKFHASVPACILALIAVRRLNAWWSIAAMSALAITSIALDTRSIALLCMLTAGVSFVASRRSAVTQRGGRPASKVAIILSGLAILAVLALAVFLIQHLGERYGYSRRFKNSNATRLASATVAWSAIRESPFIGYGSWPRDPELARQRDRIIAKEKGVPTYRMASQEDLIIAHSQVLQGWLEGGILGEVFFFVLCFFMARLLSWQLLVSPYLTLTPLLTFILLECAWNLLFSPFSGTQRIYIPAACVFLCFIAQKRLELNYLQYGRAK